MIAIFQCLFPLNILPLSFPLIFFYFYLCSKHDLKDMFKLMDVMQGSYTVLAHVGGPLCPRLVHIGHVQSYRVRVGLDPLHFICLAFLLFFSLYLHVFL